MKISKQLRRAAIWAEKSEDRHGGRFGHGLRASFAMGMVFCTAEAQNYFWKTIAAVEEKNECVVISLYFASILAKDQGL